MRPKTGVGLKNKTEQEEIALSPLKPKLKEYTLRVGKHFHKRIDHHMRLLKYLKNSNKQQWIQEAVREKLEADENSSEETADKFLHLKFDMDLWKQLEERVEALRMTHTTMSKKKIIEEAILEKLDREESKSKELLKKMLEDTQKNEI